MAHLKKIICNENNWNLAKKYLGLATKKGIDGSVVNDYSWLSGKNHLVEWWREPPTILTDNTQHSWW